MGGWFDSDLTNHGEQQAQQTAVRLKTLLRGSTPTVLSSNLLRASKTAQIISTLLGCEFQTTPDLRKISYGKADGKPNRWLQSNWIPTPKENRLDHRNLPEAETRREFATRVYRGMKPVLDSTTQKHIIVAHGFAVTFLISSWIGMAIDDVGFVNFHSSAAGITHLVEDDLFKSRSVKTLTDLQHLNVK